MGNIDRYNTAADKMKSLANIVLQMIKEHLVTEEHTLGVFLDADVVLKSDVDELQYPFLTEITSVVYTTKERELEVQGYNLERYSIGENNPAYLSLAVNMVLFIDASFDCKEMFEGFIEPLYYIVSNKKGIKEIQLTDKFRGSIDGVLEGVKIHQYFCELTADLYNNVISYTSYFKDLDLGYMHELSNLKRVTIVLGDSNNSRFRDTEIYNFLSLKHIKVEFILLYFSTVTLDDVIAALSLGNVRYNGVVDELHPIYIATDGYRGLGGRDKGDISNNYKVGTLKELGLSIFYKGKAIISKVGLGEVANSVKYWKERMPT